MSKLAQPKLKKFPAAKQRRLDELLDKNSTGSISATEKAKLEQLVSEAESLMVANAKLLARFTDEDSTDRPSNSVPVTVWVAPARAE